MIRVGKISAIDSNKYKARVYFPDKDNLTSDYLPIVIPVNLSVNVESVNYPYIAINDTVVVAYDLNKKGYIIGKLK